MKNLLLILILSTLIVFPIKASTVPDTNENNIEIAAEPVSLTDFFVDANSFLAKYISDGKVDYAAIKTEANSIKKLYTTIGEINLTGANQSTKTAFYLNAYNLIVIQSVVNNLPIAKPTDVKGFFDITKHNIAGSNLTLNELENNKLRPDPRVHFALVCAAIGCPKIAPEAFTPDKLELQLTALTKKALNDNTFIKVDDIKKTVQISKIFDWYGADFIAHSGSALKYINDYRTIKIPDTYQLTFYEYNWNLNKR